MRLLRKSLLRLLVGAQVGREEFQGDGSLQARVLGDIYDAHSAAAQLLENLEV